MPPKEATTQSKKLGALVRKARGAKGLSTRALAEALGIDFSTISYLEHGRIHRPAIETLRGLSRNLDVPLDQLYALAGYNRPEGLPEFREYVRAKYGVDASEAAELEERFHRILRRRGKEVTTA